MVYPHPLQLHCRVDALPKENIAVGEHLRHLHRNFNHALREFGEVESYLKHPFTRLKFAKDLRALVGYLNSNILPLYLDAELSVLQVQTLTYCAVVEVVRTLGRKTMPCCNTIRPQMKNDSPQKIHH